MTCPRCDRPTDREAFRTGDAQQPVLVRVPLICSRCLTDWRLRVVTGSLELKTL